MSRSAGATDVAIVGYGPVGKTLALLLAKKGWKVEVFEKFPQPYPLPRAIVFDDEVARIFQSATEIDPLMAITEPILDSYYQFRNANRETFLKFSSRKKGCITGRAATSSISRSWNRCWMTTSKSIPTSVSVWGTRW